MKIEEIRDLSIEELQAKLEELRIELFNLRFQKTKKPAGPSRPYS